MFIFLTLFIFTFASEQTCGPKCKYTITENTLTIIANGIINNTKWNTTSPITHLKLQGEVTKFNKQFISSLPELEEVEIKIKSIPNEMFMSSRLRKVVIGNNVVTIGERAFDRCEKLEEIVFEKNSHLTTIGEYAFKECEKMKEITLPKSLKTIVFESVFKKCSDELEIHIEKDGFYQSDNNMSNDGKVLEYYHGRKTPVEEVVIEYEYVFVEDRDIDETVFRSISVPSTVTEIKERAFYINYDTKAVYIPPNVRFIGKYAFAFNEELERVIIASRNLEIDESAFYGCIRLQHVVFVGEELTLNQRVFDDCDSLKEIRLMKKGEKEIETERVDIKFGGIQKGKCGTNCEYYIEENNGKTLLIYGKGSIEEFEGIDFERKQQIKDVFIMNGISGIETNVFYQFVQLRDIQLPETITTLGDYAFSKCSNLNKVYIDGTLSTFGKNPFIGSSLSKIVFKKSTSYVFIDGMLLSQSKTHLHSYIHQQSDNAMVILPDTITTIHEAAFSENKHLTTIVIQSTLKTIENKAFANCESLKHVYYLGSMEPITIGSNLFAGSNKVKELKVTEKYRSSSEMFDSVNVTKQSTHSGRSGDVYYFIDSETGIFVIYGNGSTVNYNIKKELPWENQKDIIKTAIVQKGVVTIGEHFFFNQTQLKTVILPKGLKTIKKHSFVLLNQLKSISIPSTVEVIEPNAFWKMNSFEEIIVDESNQHYTSIDGVLYSKDKTILHMYPSAKKSESLIIPNGVKTIDESAFYGVSDLGTIVLPHSLKTIKDMAFWNCKSLEKIIMNAVEEPTFNNNKKCVDVELDGCGTEKKKISCAPFNCQTSSDMTIVVPNSYVIPKNKTFCGKDMNFEKKN